MIIFFGDLRGDFGRFIEPCDLRFKSLQGDFETVGCVEPASKK